jgi:hypothetical protein
MPATGSAAPCRADREPGPRPALVIAVLAMLAMLAQGALLALCASDA